MASLRRRKGIVNLTFVPRYGWRWVPALLEEAGFEVHPANVNKLRLIAESTQKHDLGDARALANHFLPAPDLGTKSIMAWQPYMASDMLHIERQWLDEGTMILTL